jgi:hypothetical protein
MVDEGVDCTKLAVTCSAMMIWSRPDVYPATAPSRENEWMLRIRLHAL